MRNYIPNPEPIAIENATLARGKFRSNFAGEPETVNPRGGVRNFNIILDNPEDADRLLEIGWNIKQFKSSDPNTIPDHFLNVVVSYRKQAPQIFLVEIEDGEEILTPITEDDIARLDKLRISSVDVTINPYVWNWDEIRKGEATKPRIKAYLSSMYAHIEPSMTNSFKSKYKNAKIRGQMSIDDLENVNETDENGEETPFQ